MLGTGSNVNISCAVSLYVHVTDTELGSASLLFLSRNCVPLSSEDRVKLNESLHASLSSASKVLFSLYSAPT